MVTKVKVKPEVAALDPGNIMDQLEKMKLDILGPKQLKLLKALVDKFGVQKSIFAEAKKEVDRMSGIFKETDLNELEGDLYRITISRYEMERYDTAKLEKLVDAKILAKCKSVTPCVAVKCHSKTGGAKKK